MKNKNKILSEDKEIIDLGISSKVIDTKRIINRDGSFNVLRKGLKFFQSFSTYHWLISMSWTRFCLLILGSYLLVNIFYASLYYLGGEENFEGIKASTNFERFLNEFFFSTQTFTTVGYGRVNPVGVYANVISSIESLMGLLSLAVATGLLYGRFVRPYAKILYSDTAVIAPFKDHTAFQFRIANMRSTHQMVDVEIEVLLSFVDVDKRRFVNLDLEYKKINFFNATWTVNHVINEESPLFGLNESDLKGSEAEFLILLKGFDDTFAQIIHSRSSYRYDEIVWKAKFISVYTISEEGMITIELDKISDYEKV
ncbi:MAG: ion channel [bacterium]